MRQQTALKDLNYEQDNGQYKVSIMRRDDENEDFDIGF